MSRRPHSSAWGSVGPPRPSLAAAKHSSPRNRTSSSRRRQSSSQGRSWPWSSGRLATWYATPDGPQASAHSPAATCDSARCSASNAASTSTNASGGSTSSICDRPDRSSGPMTRRSFESRTLSRGLVVGRRLLAVDARQQLVAIDPAEPVEHEVGEEQAPLGARQRVLDPSPVQPHHEPAAELDPRPAVAPSPQFRKIGERFGKRPVRDHRAESLERERKERSNAHAHATGRLRSTARRRRRCTRPRRSSSISPVCTRAPASRSRTSSPSSTPRRGGSSTRRRCRTSATSCTTSAGTAAARPATGLTART